MVSRGQKIDAAKAAGSFTAGQKNAPLLAHLSPTLVKDNEEEETACLLGAGDAIYWMMDAFDFLAKVPGSAELPEVVDSVKIVIQRKKRMSNFEVGVG